MKIRGFSNRWAGWILLGILLLWGWMGLIPARAASQVESRLAQVEFELRQVRSELSQVEARISQPNLSTATPTRPAPPVTSTAANPSLETQFDNLATLAVELKQQVRALETRVSRLEESRNRT